MRASLFFLLLSLHSLPALAQESLVKYLPTTNASDLAITPDGSRVIIGKEMNELDVIDVATDQLIETWELPEISTEDKWIEDVAFTPTGRLFVSTDYYIYELDPATGAVLQQADTPAGWSGKLAFTLDGQRGYVAARYEVFVFDLDPLAFVDTTPGDGGLNGLMEANPTWVVTDDWIDAIRIQISPDQDRLYLTGDRVNANNRLELVVIDGLNGSFDALTMSLYEIPNNTPSDDEVRIELSPDGAKLHDSYGNTWNTSTMTVVGTVNWSVWDRFQPTMLVASPDRALYLYEGWGPLDQIGTYEGESLLFVNTAGEVIDIDEDPSNGLTGIDLPEHGGWGVFGRFVEHQMAITPDGKKLYMALGSSGSLAVTLDNSFTTTGVHPNKGGNDGDVTVRIAGVPFSANTEVELQKGTITIEGETKTADGQLEVRFNLREQPIGLYDVVLTTAGEPPTRMTNGFTVEESDENAFVELIGSTFFEAAREARLRVVATNIGNQDLNDLIVTINLSEGTRYKTKLPSLYVGEAKVQEDTEFTTVTDNQPEYVWISRLRPGQRYEFQLLIKGPDNLPPTEWNISVGSIVGYISGPDPAPPSVGLRPGRCDKKLIGELCTVGDAIVKGIIKESKRQGASPDETGVAEAVTNVIREATIEYGTAKISGLIAQSITVLVVGLAFPPALPVAVVTFTIINDLKSCFDFVKSLLELDALFSWDPNDKLSSTGIDGYFLGKGPLRYIIRFENDAAATAPARTVTITDPLEANYDLSTFELVGSSHPAVLSVDLEESSRRLTFTFAEINLPPNVTSPEGEGWVEFTIEPKADLTSGTIITNSASIVFDLNEPILTEAVTHEVDLVAPVSKVDVPPTTIGEQVTLSWASVETGVGVWDYAVYVATGNGELQPWIERTTDRTAKFTGEIGKQYRFAVIARDRLGNAEQDLIASATILKSEEEEDGCGCTTQQQSNNTPLWALLLFCFVARRVPRR